MIKSLLSTALELIFPKICITCEERSAIPKNEFCLWCLTDLPKIDVLKDSAQYLLGKEMFPENLPFYSYFYFCRGNASQKILHAIKYQSNKNLAFKLGYLLGSELSELNWKDYAIVPVPIHKRKKFKRGYNQSEEIAKGIAKRLELPVWNDALIRPGESKSQTQKTKDQRYRVDQNSFIINGKSKYKYTKILLIDDVVTTGSTISACVASLNSIPADKIQVASLAVAI